ncbi:hypothetical protein PRBEI_2001825100 [Prionailurus iriomotensis]
MSRLVVVNDACIAGIEGLTSEFWKTCQEITMSLSIAVNGGDITGIQVRRKNLANSRDCKLRDNRVSNGEISLPKVTGRLNESRSDTRDKVLTRSLLRYDGKLHKDDERDFVCIRTPAQEEIMSLFKGLVPGALQVCPGNVSLIQITIMGFCSYPSKRRHAPAMILIPLHMSRCPELLRYSGKR